MIENKSRRKIHPSHKMTNWKDDVVKFFDRPRICSVRECLCCEAKQAEGEYMNYIDPGLWHKCKENS